MVNGQQSDGKNQKNSHSLVPEPGLAQAGGAGGADGKQLTILTRIPIKCFPEQLAEKTGSVR